MAAQQPSSRTSTFYDHLKQALGLINDPALLGERSPLATPYFLGDSLHGVEPTPYGRGQALGAAIMRAAEQLWGGPLPDDGQELLAVAMAEAPAAGRYDCLILELNYFQRRFHPAPRNQAAIYSDFLHISRPTHDRHLRAAVERLGAALLQQIRPAIHLEQPAAPAILIGREPLLAQIDAELRGGRTVGLVGRGGVGKTAIGAVIGERWGSPPFWYTFRPGLNDQLASLLFSLGYFLHRRGASALWHHLIGEPGRVAEGGLALSLALADIAELPAPALICFDELDVLRSAAQEQAAPAHARLLEFLDGLRGHAPLLLIGQRALLVCDTVVPVEELSRDQLAEWLDALAIPHTAADAGQLHDYTAGNMRMAELCAALYHTGAADSLSGVLAQLPRSQALLPLWLRLERRLSAAERRLLQILAVFRSPAPADAWPADASEPDTLAQLVARRLVQHDERGGVALLPALREIVYAELPVELREELHNQAAQIRAERGAYTAAAYHLVEAGRPEAAIALWYENRAQEIEQGQADAALAIFSRISQRRLAPGQRKVLLLLRAELYELTGAPARVVAELSQDDWPAEDPLAPAAMLRLGQAMEAQGQPERALETYQSGLDAVTTLLRQSTQLHVQRSLTSMRRREVRQAWREAHLARFHAEMMLGIVHEQSGDDYSTAYVHYITALAIAEQVGYNAGVADSHHYLAILAGRRQQTDEALKHFTQAIEFYERIGDRVNREVVRSNLASAHIQARRFAEALAPAEQALRFFESIGHSSRIAQNASNLAEAHAELGNLDRAQHYAEIVLQLEEPQSHPYALYTLGTVARQRGDLEQAERSYDQSRRIAEMHDDSYLAAFAWRAIGEVSRARGASDRARQAFAQALELFRRLSLSDEAGETERLAAQPDANPRGIDA